MEEIYQMTVALKQLSWGKTVAVLTDAGFSGVSTGACIGDVDPEAVAGGPIGKVPDGDLIQIANRPPLARAIDRSGRAGGAQVLRHRGSPRADVGGATP